jgi:AraC-like DNA-binding protein
MHLTAIEIEHLPAGLKDNTWQTALSEFAIQTASKTSPAPSVQRGQLKVFTSSTGFIFTLVKASEQILAPMAGMAGSMFWLNLVLQGEALAKIEGQALPLKRGDILYGHRGAAGNLEIGENFEMLMVNIPADVVRRKQYVWLPERTLKLDQAKGTAKLLSDLLLSVAGEIDRLSDTAIVALEAAILPLLTAGVFDERKESESMGSEAAYRRLMQRLCTSIDAQLSDERLTIQRIAREQGMSVRYVQKLFSRHGDSFRHYIRKRRLDQCREMMSDPAQAAVSITTICLNWGFNDPAYFSRNFRLEYGVSPSEFRRAAMASQKVGALNCTCPKWVPACVSGGGLCSRKKALGVC